MVVRDFSERLPGSGLPAASRNGVGFPQLNAIAVHKKQQEKEQKGVKQNR